MSKPNDSSEVPPPPQAGQTSPPITTPPPSPPHAPQSPLPPISPSTVKVSSTNVGAAGGSSSGGSILGGGNTRPLVVLPPAARQETASPRPTATRKQPETPGPHTFGDSPTRMTVNVGGAGSGIGGGGSPLRKKFRGGGGNGGGGSSSGSKLVPTNPTRNDPFPCSVDGCGRSFGSVKALHGHMRAHRDRGWTGTYAPPTFSPDELSRTFKNTMDIVGGRVAAAEAGGGDVAEEVVEQVEVAEEQEQVGAEDVGLEVQQAVGINVLAEAGPEAEEVQLAGNNVLAEEGPEAEEVQLAGNNVLAEEGAVVLLDLNELPRESQEEAAAASTSEARAVAESGERKLFDLNEFPSPDTNEED